MIDSEDDLDVVHRLMWEAGLEDEDALGPVLLELRALGNGRTPPPSAAVAALMTERPRRRAGRAGVVVALAVTASLGAGLTAAAASPALRERAASAVAALGSPAVQRPALPRVEEAPPIRSAPPVLEDDPQDSAAVSSPAARRSAVPAPLDSGAPGDGRGRGTGRKQAAAAPTPSPTPSVGAAGSSGRRGGSGSSGRGGAVSPSPSGKNAQQVKDGGKRSDDAVGSATDD